MRYNATSQPYSICAYHPSDPTITSVVTTGGLFNVTALPPNNTGGPDVGEWMHALQPGSFI